MKNSHSQGFERETEKRKQAIGTENYFHQFSPNRIDLCLDYHRSANERSMLNEN